MKELARLPYKGGYIWVELKAPIQVGDCIYDWEFKLVHHHVEHGRTMGKVLVRAQSVNNPEIIEGLAFVDGVDVREVEFISEFVESVVNPNKINFETQKLVWTGSDWVKYTEDFVDVEEKHLTEELLTYIKDGKTFLKTL